MEEFCPESTQWRRRGSIDCIPFLKLKNESSGEAGPVRIGILLEQGERKPNALVGRSFSCATASLLLLAFLLKIFAFAAFPFTFFLQCAHAQPEARLFSGSLVLTVARGCSWAA